MGAHGELPRPRRASRRPHNLLDDLYAMDEPGGAYEGTTIDGYPGRWVLVITPFC